MRELIVAARGSALSANQAESVCAELKKKNVSVRLIFISTKGDIDRTQPLCSIGGNGLFVRGIEEALVSKKADVAVHSAKDLPNKIHDGLEIAAVMPASSPNDVIITKKGKSLSRCDVIGTGSARRRFQAKKLYPDCTFKEIRGNVDSRLNKLLTGEYDALILAKAGLERLGAELSDFDVSVLETENFVPAACQGIIAVQCRSDDNETKRLLRSISDKKTEMRFNAERYMLSILNADCSLPVGAFAEIFEEEITITALFDGKKSKRTGAYESYRRLCEEIRHEICG